MRNLMGSRVYYSGGSTHLPTTWPGFGFGMDVICGLALLARYSAGFSLTIGVAGEYCKVTAGLL